MNLNLQSYKKPLIARPGQLLEDHLKDVMRKGIHFFSHWIKDNYKKLWEAGLFFHDIGKGEFSIQDALYNDKKPPISHTHLSVIFFYSWLVDHLKKDLVDLLDDRQVKIIAFAILSHHSPPHRDLEYNIFGQLFNRNITIAQEAFDILKKYGFHVLKETFTETYKSIVECYRENVFEILLQNKLKHDSRKSFVLFYNALVKSDWYSAMGEDISSYNISPSLITELIDPKRSEVHIYIKSNEKFKENILLELPTGFGKTFLGLGYAAKTGRERIIYTLPVTTIIEDVYSKVSEKIGEENIEWYTSKYLIFKSLKESFDEKSYLDAKYFTKPIIVTTLDQLLLAFLGIDRYPVKEAAVYNSCIILDEPQLYSPLMLFLFAEFIKDYKDYLNIAIMTATMPDFLKNRIAEFFIEPFSDCKEAIFRRYNRYYLDIQYLGESIKNDQFKTKLINKITSLIEKGKKVIVILNTVEKAQNFFKLLPDIPKYLFHARYIYRDRINKLENLKKFLKNPGVVVSTQAIEAGVDISCDVMFREIAPFDSIIQSAGRVNRDNAHSEPCPIYLYGTDEDHLPYKKEILEITHNLLCNYCKGGRLNAESYLFNLFGEYWQELNNYCSETSNKANELYKISREISPIALAVEEAQIKLRDTYLKLSVIPIKYFDNILQLLQQYKSTNKKDYWRRKKILSEVESHMVEIPYWSKVNDKSFKDFIVEENEFKFINLKYDESLGLLPEEDSSLIL